MLRVLDPQDAIARSLNSAFPSTPIATVTWDPSAGPGVHPGVYSPASPVPSLNTTQDGDIS